MGTSFWAVRCTFGVRYRFHAPLDDHRLSRLHLSGDADGDAGPGERDRVRAVAASADEGVGWLAADAVRGLVDQLFLHPVFPPLRGAVFLLLAAGAARGADADLFHGRVCGQRGVSLLGHHSARSAGS